MRDFHLMPSINIWFDGEKYYANLDWQDTEEKPIEISANSASVLASKVSSKIQLEIVKRSKANA